jgi:hypothetical protein
MTTDPAGREVSQPPQKSRKQRQPLQATDDEYRRITAEQLALALIHSENLLERCAGMAEDAGHNEYGAIHATARLMNATAQVAKALAQVTHVERRSRRIIETIQAPQPELNSLFSASRISSPQQRAKMRDLLERALLQFLEEQKRDREQQEALLLGGGI